MWTKTERVLQVTVCLALLFTTIQAGKEDVPYTRDVRNKVFERQALLEAYEEFGIDHHKCQNEFEILKYAPMKDMTPASASNSDIVSRSSSSSGGRALEQDTVIKAPIPPGESWIISDVKPRNIWNDDMVTVSFKASAPKHDDWIAAYSPPDVNIEDTVPVKYGFCDDFNTGYLSNGVGTMTFNMTNLRAGVRFYYIIGGFKSETKQAVNSTAPMGTKAAMDLQFFDNNEQLRPRVVPTGDLDEYTVLWSSNSPGAPTLVWSSDVKDVPGSVTDPKFTSASNVNVGTGAALTITGKTTTIEKSELCGYPANKEGWRDMGYIHSAPLKGMRALANQKVYYTFGDAASDKWTRWDGNGTQRVWELFVPPLPGTQPPNRPTTIVWFDDLGRGSNDQAWTWNHYGEASIFTSKSVGHLAANGKIDGIYHGGDLSYAVGYEVVWDFFMDMISPMASHTLYMTTMGNHETDFPGTSSYYTGYDSGGECSVSAIKMLPQPTPATQTAPWWSYKIGLMHIVGMSSEQNFTTGSPQWLWLENDLKSVNRTETPWILFGAHRAMYLSSNYGPDNAEGELIPSSDIANMDLMVKHLEPLLWKYKVNLGMYGHMHCVQRQSAILEQRVVQAASMEVDKDGNTVAMHRNPQATVHYLLGTGGADLMTSVNPVTPAWNEKNIFKWGYSVIEAVDATTLNFKWVDSVNGNEVLDRMTITQEDPSKNSTSAMWTCPPGGGFTVCTCVNDCTPEAAGQDGVNRVLAWSVGIGCGLLLLGAIWYYRRSKNAIVNREGRANSIVELPAHVSAAPSHGSSRSNSRSDSLGDYDIASSDPIESDLAYSKMQSNPIQTGSAKKNKEDQHQTWDTRAHTKNSPLGDRLI